MLETKGGARRERLSGYINSPLTSKFAPMSEVGQDQSAIRDAKAQARVLDERNAVEELSWLMSDAKGRRFMWRLLQRSGVYQMSFVPGGPEGDRATAFNEGRRSEGNRLVAMVMQHCPGRYTEMQKEASKHERRSTGK